MDLQHDLRRHFLVHGEELLQHVDYEVHGREIIVQQDELETPGRNGLGAGGLQEETALLFLLGIICL
jgi:hypothetical protein